MTQCEPGGRRPVSWPRAYDAAEVAGTQVSLGFQGLMVLARSGRPPAELRRAEPSPC